MVAKVIVVIPAKSELTTTVDTTAWNDFFVAFNAQYQNTTKYCLWLQIQLETLTEEEKALLSVKLSVFPSMVLDNLKRELGIQTLNILRVWNKMSDHFSSLDKLYCASLSLFSNHEKLLLDKDKPTDTSARHEHMAKIFQSGQSQALPQSPSTTTNDAATSSTASHSRDTNEMTDLTDNSENLHYAYFSV